MFPKTMVAVLALGLAALAACGGSSTGDSGSNKDFTTPYAFAGTWTFARTVTEDPVGWSADDRGHGLGSTYNSTFAITLNGNAIVADDRTAPFPPETYGGTADLDEGTATLTYRFSTPTDPNYIVSTLTLTAESDTRMTGVWVSDEHASPGFPSGKHMKHTIVATRR